MSNSFEIIVIAVIVAVQLYVAIRTFRQINIMNDFLPEGRSSLKLEEYEIPTEEILGLNPSDVVGRLKYKVVSKINQQEDNEGETSNTTSPIRPRSTEEDIWEDFHSY